MINILLISDNPLFIQRVYKSLKDADRVILHASLSASGIFEAYLQYQPAIIVLDHTFLLPITSILKHFSTYRWDCAFIVVGSSTHAADAPSNVVFVAGASDVPPAVLALRTQPAVHINRSLPLSISALQESHPLQPDIYYLMLAMCTDPGANPIAAETLTRLKSQIATIGDPEIMMPFQRDLLIVMKKSTMRMHGAFRQVHSIVCKVLGQGYASICCEDLTLDQLDPTLAEILLRSPLRCFFSSCCYSLDKIISIEETRTMPDVFPLFLHAIDALLDHHPDSLQSSLNKWFLSTLKLQLDRKALQLTRSWQSFFDHTIFSSYLPPLCCPTSTGTIENEYRLVAQHWSDIYQAYWKRPLLPVVQESVQLILKELSNPELSLAFVARKLDFSKAYVSRIFREQTSLTVGGVLQQLRIEYACNLLKITSKSIKSIAARVGYLDSQYFSKVFHRKTGLYPTDYRALHLKER